MSSGTKLVCAFNHFKGRCIMTLKCFFFLTGERVIAYCDKKLLPFPTLRHSECEVLLSAVIEGERCIKCSDYRSSLRSMLSREKKKQPFECRTHPSSHVSYKTLSSPEKLERMRQLHLLQRSTSKQLAHLQAKLLQDTQDVGIDVDEEVHQDLKTVVAEQSAFVKANFPQGTFKRVFWEQQRQANLAADARSRRWHPLMIKCDRIWENPTFCIFHQN